MKKVNKCLKKMTTIKDEKSYYTECVKDIIVGFQYMETGLKIYLQNTFALIKIYLRDKLFFGYKYDDIKDWDLRRTLYLFNRLNNNTELKEMMNDKLIAKRNYYAHEGFMLWKLEYEKKLGNQRWLRNEIDKCNNLYKKIQIINGLISKEHEQLNKTLNSLIQPTFNLK